MNDSDYKTITHDTYNQIAADYIARDQIVIKETEEVQASVRHFASLLPPKAHVLDIGIGGGRDSRLFAESGFTVLGIDIAEELLAQAAVLESTGLITYELMDVEELDVPAGSFDGVWANASLHHVPKAHLPQVLERLHEALKSGGYLQIKVHRGISEGLVEEIKFNQPVVRYFAKYEPQELSSVVQAAGFLTIEVNLATEGKWVDLLAQKVG